MDYYDLYIQDPNPSREPEPELDDSAGLESYSYAEEYSYPPSYLEHRQFLATSYLHQPWPWSWECECFLTSFSNGLFEQLNDTSWTLEPNDWQIPQTQDFPTVRRLSCGSDGVGTVDPVEACAFEPYADTLVDPYDVGERERVDDWLNSKAISPTNLPTTMRNLIATRMSTSARLYPSSPIRNTRHHRGHESGPEPRNPRNARWQGNPRANFFTAKELPRRTTTYQLLKQKMCPSPKQPSTPPSPPARNSLPMPPSSPRNYNTCSSWAA
ncbi:hypothetical protein C8F01DRAFT_123756 [Mycena amicta]|nr:hypothetical protein C8F01DRAFT_123756 [Mycena amicta]